jgi:hypothetical protein
MADEQAVPEPVPSIRPPATAQQAAAAADDPLARAAALRREAAQIEAGLAGPAVVRVKVAAPHSAMQFGGLYVGPDFTPVPASRLTDLLQAAGRAGVTLITEG